VGHLWCWQVSGVVRLSCVACVRVDGAASAASEVLWKDEKAYGTNPSKQKAVSLSVCLSACVCLPVCWRVDPAVNLGFLDLSLSLSSSTPSLGVQVLDPFGVRVFPEARDRFVAWKGRVSFLIACWDWWRYAGSLVVQVGFWLHQDNQVHLPFLFFVCRRCF
jgi:hypothetical protein